MKFRHEEKIEIDKVDVAALRSRLSAVANPDRYSVDGKYFIRSLYFDNLNDKALREKQDGVNVREKFRIRYYNRDTSFIRLEKKSKLNGLCQKTSVVVSEAEVKALISFDKEVLSRSQKQLVTELYSKMLSTGLRAKTIVDYEREAFCFAPGNVRITIDGNIRTGILSTDFLNTESVTVPATEQTVLEVKWDEFLPDIIRDAVRLDGCRVGAFSKYAACRIYG